MEANRLLQNGEGATKAISGWGNPIGPKPIGICIAGTIYDGSVGVDKKKASEVDHFLQRRLKIFPQMQVIIKSRPSEGENDS